MFGKLMQKVVLWRGYIAAGLVGGLMGATLFALAAGQLGGGAKNRAHIEAIVQNYIMGHPEIIPAAVQQLQRREYAAIINANRAAFETPFGSAWAGAEKGDVVLVEFFDYACGFCHKSNADVERLLAEDKNLKVVWREFPVLGSDSVNAAHVSLAAANQGKFRQFHDRVFATARPTPDVVLAAQKSVGVVMQSVTPAMRMEIEKNYQLAGALRAAGTPQFVIGDQVLQGAVGYDALKQAVAEARASNQARS